ncbi:unnamed protein product [Ixodes hexagonus]
MATGNFALTDLMLLADVATTQAEQERPRSGLAEMTAALSHDTPTVSPVVSMPQSTEMSRDSTALVAAFAHALQSMQRETPPPKTLIRIPVPEYSGHSDRAMSATDFLLAIQQYRKATGLTEKETLGRVLPVALVGPAASGIALWASQPEHSTSSRPSSDKNSCRQTTCQECAGNWRKERRLPLSPSRNTCGRCRNSFRSPIRRLRTRSRSSGW